MPDSNQNQSAGQSATVVAIGGQNGELTLRLSDGSEVVASGQTNADLKVGSSVVASRSSSGSYLALAAQASQPLLNRSTYQGKSLHSTSWDVDYGRGRLFNEDVGKKKTYSIIVLRFRGSGQAVAQIVSTRIESFESSGLGVLLPGQELRMGFGEGGGDGSGYNILETDYGTSGILAANTNAYSNFQGSAVARVAQGVVYPDVIKATNLVFSIWGGTSANVYTQYPDATAELSGAFYTVSDEAHDIGYPPGIQVTDTYRLGEFNSDAGFGGFLSSDIVSTSPLLTEETDPVVFTAVYPSPKPYPDPFFKRLGTMTIDILAKEIKFG